MAIGEPILILHLSDLHFGQHSRFPEEPATIAKVAAQLAQAVAAERKRGRITRPVDLVLVTDDLAEGARPPEYQQAATFCTTLAEHLPLARQRFVFLPGNHDLSHSLCKRKQAQLEGEYDDLRKTVPPETLAAGLEEVKFGNFERFVQEFLGVPRQQAGVALTGNALIHTFDELNLSLACANSCEGITHDNRSGSISQAQAEALNDQWRYDGLRILALHHNPGPTVPANVDDWRQFSKKHLDPELIEKLIDDLAGVQGHEMLLQAARNTKAHLILHGHQHAAHQVACFHTETEKTLPILAAGSLGVQNGKLPKEYPNTCQLLWVQPRAKQLRRLKLVYSPRLDDNGGVAPGGFTADANKLDGNRFTLHYLPTLPPVESGATRGRKKTPSPPAEDFSAAIASYRNRLRARFERYDMSNLGAAQGGGVGRPNRAADLEEMFVPLRLGSNRDPDTLDDGQSITPEHLLQKGVGSWIIRGAAGSGKTTWMRWTFRQLLRQEGVFPLFVELRGLAKLWSEEKEIKRTNLDAFLLLSMENEGLHGDNNWVLRLLKNGQGPQPLLLVDGWDELGELGDHFRKLLLGFMADHPRIRVVATSRPYGVGVPSGRDGFLEQIVQPLNDAEITDLSERFFRFCYGEDGIPLAKALELFKTALQNSPGAQSLARTALLLVMMLLVSRTDQLPDKRHRLYQKCLDNLLNAPREEQGVQLTVSQWRPDDPKLRFQAAAALAAKAQEAGYQNQNRDSIVHTWDNMLAWLPSDWEEQQCYGFLEWLAGPAGVLIDRGNGQLVFAHLSFQEFLTAAHLAVKVEGDQQRTALCLEKITNLNWWETMRLWAALVRDGRKENLVPVLAKLLEEEERGLWFAGALFADDLGDKAQFDRWLELALGTLQRLMDYHTDDGLKPWAASRQEERKQALSQHIHLAAQQATWFAWLRLEHAAQLTGTSAPPAPNSTLSISCLHVTELMGDNQRVLTRPQMAMGRLLAGFAPGWPGRAAPELIFLQSWTGIRPQLGSRFQTMAVNRLLAPAANSTRLTLIPRAQNYGEQLELVSSCIN